MGKPEATDDQIYILVDQLWNLPAIQAVFERGHELQLPDNVFQSVIFTSKETALRKSVPSK